MQARHYLMLVLSVGMFHYGCGKAVSQAAGAATAATDDAAAAPANTSAEDAVAQQGAQSADDAGTSGAAIHSNNLATLALKNTLAAAGLLNQSRCFDNSHVTRHSPDANSTTVTMVYTGTDCKKAGRTITGFETIIYNKEAMTLSVDTNVTTTFKGGDVLLVNSNDASRPTEVLTTSGLPATGNVTHVVTLNEHRVRRSATGGVRFDHTMLTDPNNPLTVVNSYAAAGLATTMPLPTFRTTTGVVIALHNLAKFNTVNTFVAVGRDLTTGCECPSSGMLTQVVTHDTGNASFTRSYTFTDCGVATVVTSNSTLAQIPNGTATMTWDACQD